MKHCKIKCFNETYHTQKLNKIKNYKRDNKNWNGGKCVCARCVELGFFFGISAVVYACVCVCVCLMSMGFVLFDQK